MKRFARVIILLPLMLVLSMAGFSDYEIHTDQTKNAVVEAMVGTFGTAPLAAQNGEASCRSCEEEFDDETGLYKHRFLFGGICGGNDLEGASLGTGCRECTGEDVAQCDSGDDCCHRGWTPPSANLGCWNHDTCSSGGDPDPDFSPIEVAHLIDRMVVGDAWESGPDGMEIASEVLARLVASEAGVSFAAATGRIQLFGCRDDSLPVQVWMIPPGVRDAFVERHRVARREG